LEKSDTEVLAQSRLKPDAKPEGQHEAVSKMIDEEGLLPLLNEKACDANLAKSEVA
jgi:hypothetical protein